MNTTMLCSTNSSVIFRFLILHILAIMPAVLFAQQDVSIWDFRIPETKYQRLTGNLSGGWNNTEQNNTDYSFGAPQDHSSNSTKSSSVQSTLAYNFANYNENNSLEITANVTGQANHQSSDGSQSYVTSIPLMYSALSSQVYTNYNVEIAPAILYSNYIIPDTWHWFAEGSGNYSFNQYINNSNTTYSDGSYSYDSTYFKNNSWSASVSGGIGYGKLRDGSSVFAVLRILDKLTEDSMLIRPLTRDEVLRIVDIFARRVEYTYTQDRFVKYFMEDVFGQLQKMGVLKENAATAYSVLRAVEVLSEQIAPRLFGWRARLGVQRSFTEGVSGASGMYPQNYTSSYLWYFRDYVSLAFDYGYPLTLNLQVNSSLSIEIPFIDYQRKIGYMFQIAGIYQIGERIDATISGSVSRTTDLFQGTDENEFLRNMQYNAGISFRFFIENNINFNVSCKYSEYYQDNFSLSYSRNSASKYPTISFGVSYRFL
jgi:hypothetical protein